ncbi:MAG: hypothetical protein IPL61_29040 [Myxococcales bacterium]|nr:hypothetical protein [Myxococcales bacterium]
MARDYARAPFKVAAAHGHAPAFDRAAEVEDLLVLLGVMASDAAALPPGGIWIGERVGGLVALVACARAAGAIVVEGAATPAAAAIARADDLAVAAEVRGLHAWVRPGDRCTVDADADGAAVVRVNPPGRGRSVRHRARRGATSEAATRSTTPRLAAYARSVTERGAARPARRRRDRRNPGRPRTRGPPPSAAQREQRGVDAIDKAPAGRVRSARSCRWAPSSSDASASASCRCSGCRCWCSCSCT